MIIPSANRFILHLLITFTLASAQSNTDHTGPEKSNHIALRVMTMNAHDIGSLDLIDGQNPRLKRLAEIIQRIRPNVLLLSEIARDPDGRNAERFVDLYLNTPQADDLQPINYNTTMPESNTGIYSGFDFNHDGLTNNRPQPPRYSDPNGTPPPQTALGRTYGNDCYGFGTYPGQYSLALLVDPQLELDSDSIRTFQNFLWKDLPGSTPPLDQEGRPWYTPEQWASFRLSSKTFADIPVILPDGTPLHLLISHPTPPAFDGPEARNKHRNHDEIALIRAYIDNTPELVDDHGNQGGLNPGALFVILGDLNADPVDGSSINSPVTNLLFSSEALAPDPKPSSPITIDRLDPFDTARFRLRVDYVLPSTRIRVLRSAIWRHDHDSEEGFPSDHFPVWAELAIPTRQE